MKTKMLALAFVALAPFAASADGISYSNADLAYITADSSGTSNSGYGLSGMFAFSDAFYGVAGYSDVNSATAYNLGAGWHMSMSGSTDFFAELSYISVDVGIASDTGYDFGLGVRGMASDALELNARIDMVDIGGGSDTNYGIGGVYYFDSFGITAGYTSANSVDAYAIGVRFTF